MNKIPKIEEEVDFKAIAKSPLRWFGLFYPLFIFSLILVGGYYVLNLNWIVINKITPTIPESKNIPDLTVVKGSIAAGVDLNSIKNPTDGLISRGKELYANNCSSCHGIEGKGDGIAGSALNPTPRNFSSKDNWKNGLKLSDIFRTLAEGIKGSAMVAYDYLPIEDRFALIYYIRSLYSIYPEFTEDELNELNFAFSLEKGRIIPNQIPVSKAISILSKESDRLEIDKIINKINDNQSAYEVFNKISCNKKKAVYTLVSSQLWKTDLNAWIQSALSQASGNGFKTNIIRTSNEELEILFNYLKTII